MKFQIHNYHNPIHSGTINYRFLLFMVCPRAIPIFEDAVKSHLKRTTIAAATKLLWEPNLDSTTPQCLYDNTYIVDSIIVYIYILGRKQMYAQCKEHKF